MQAAIRISKMRKRVGSGGGERDRQTDRLTKTTKLWKNCDPHSLLLGSKMMIVGNS
jgi:hypothetical protein